MTTFYLIRHGEIDANVKRLWHGSTDSELNPNGEAQARKMGKSVQDKYPFISNIYASPLKRTLKTAAALGEAIGQSPQSHHGLREFGVGEWEGMDYDVLNTEYGFFNSMQDNQDFAPSGGESVNGVRNRMLAAFDEIRDRHQGEHIALVGHGAAIAIALASVLNGSPFPFYDYHMDNTGVSILNWGNPARSTTPELVSFNETSHLDGSNQEG